MDIERQLIDFIAYVDHLKGDEKSEAQLFCDRFFRAFGHGGIIEAHGELESRIKFDSGRTKFADCLWSPPGKNGVLIEMKKKSIKNLEAHFPQVRDYWIEMKPEIVIGPGAQKPTYIILCNFERFLIYRLLTLVDDISINTLLDRSSAFNFMLAEQKEPIFHHNVEAISQDAARTMGDLFKYLINNRKETRETSQRFVLQSVLSLFSEDFGLLPHYFFTELIHECRSGQSSYDLLGGLFRQMASPTPAKGGRFKEIKYFNGGLLDKVEPIELDSFCLDLLEKASNYNWKYVNPAIFGSLFESTLGDEERHTYGAHFTREADILKIVYPSIVRPWKTLLSKATRLSDLKSLLDNLGKFVVFDPACGCGNFLYVAYRALKDIEMQIIEKIAQEFTSRTISSLHVGFSQVTTKQFFGIDILPIAVEVAKMTMMLAKELAADEWNNRISLLMGTLGLNIDEGLPLDRLDDCIVQGDALLVNWPKFDVVISNPPYQSKNKMQQEMGRTYIDNIRNLYPEVPGRADYCVYWFRRIHDEMKQGQRAGLVATNTIRENYSRQGGLDYIVNNGGTITEAVSSQVWPGDAVVHVSIVNWLKGEDQSEKQLSIQNGDSIDSPFIYYRLDKLNSALSPKLDVSGAKDLMINKSSCACYEGQTHGHKGFLLKKEKAYHYILVNPTYKEVLFPFLISNELLGNFKSLPERYVIDFRKCDVFSAKEYPDLYKIVSELVLPERKLKADQEDERNASTLSKNPRAKVNHHHKNFFRLWWKLDYARNELMDKLEIIPRYIVCCRHTKRPIFEFVDSGIHPNDSLQVFPLEDDYSFGILQSSIHWEWFQERCSTIKREWRYTSNTVFDSFPWPQNPQLQDIKRVSEIASSLRIMRREIMNEHGLSLRELYKVMEKTPDNPVSLIQDELDEAVRNVYDMRKNDPILSFLLSLNKAVSEAEQDGYKVHGPGLPDIIKNKVEFITNDCVKIEKL